MGIKASAQYTIAEINEEYSVLISNESHVFRADKNNTAIAASTSIQVYGYQGSTQIATKVGTISGLPSTGMTAAINNNNSVNASITITVTTALTSSIANNGVLTIPITVGNKTINKVFSWSKAQAGEDGPKGDKGATGPKGDKGDKGETGEDGLGIASSSVDYQAWSNGTSIPSGKWSPSVPKATADKPYIWSRTTITYTDGSKKYTYAIGATPEGITVGGRNYIFNSNVQLMRTDDDRNTNKSNMFDTYLDDVNNIELFKGKTVTISLDVETIDVYSTNTSGYIRFGFEMAINKSSGGNFYVGRWIDLNSTYNADNPYNFKGRITDTFTIPSDITNIDYAGIYIQGITNGSVVIGKPKLELGNKATDWTPAPEDVENEILQRPTQDAVTDQISQSLKNATDSIDQTIAEKIGQSRTEIDKSTDEKISAANKTIKQEIDSTTGEKIRDLEYFASKMTLKGNEFSIGIEKTKGINLIKNSVMKQHKERGGSGANSRNIKANFWLNNSLKEDYLLNVLYGEDSVSRSNTDSGSYFRFNLTSSNNIQLDYIFSDPIDFKKNTSNIILSYKLRQMQKLTNGVFFIGLVFYRQDTSATGMGAVSKTAGIPTGYYVPVTEYSNANLTGSFVGDYIYKTMPITRQGSVEVEETLEVKETITNGNVTERYVNLTYAPSTSKPTVDILSYGSEAVEQFKATNKKVILRLTDTRKVITAQYVRDLRSFVAMDSPTDAKIKAALAKLPISEVTVYYNSANKKIWTYNPFTGAFIETSNLYDTTTVDTNIDTVRVVMGVRSTNSTAMTGQVDVSDVKLEYDSVSTIWTQNVGETYSKQYKMDEKGFSISSDTNTMFIDEDEIAAYKSNENGELDMNNPVFQIKEDETILRQTTIYDQLNIENTNEKREDAFVMKQQLIGNKWYFVFY